MKIIVSIGPNESRISAKVEKWCGDNYDHMILIMMMSFLCLSQIEDF